MAGTVSQYQQGAFATPVNNTTGDATVVLSNDNAVCAKHNSHDGDATIHFQSSVNASRPVAGTLGRKWMDSDTYRVYYDDGTNWHEVAYLPLAGGTTTGQGIFGQGIQVTGSTGSINAGDIAKDASSGLVIVGCIGSFADVEIKSGTGSLVFYVPTGTTTGKFVGKINAASLPTSVTGLATGDLWNNAGVINIK